MDKQILRESMYKTIRLISVGDINKKVTFLIIGVLVFTASGLAGSVNAATLDNSYLALGDPRPSETGTYEVQAGNFTTGTAINCIEVSLNTQADGAGSVPSGMTTTSSTLDSATVITAGSWAVDNTTNGTLRITNAGGENPAASGNVVWGGVVNGDTEGTTYYGLITTYANIDCTSSLTDSVTVAYVYKASESAQLVINPTLNFVCVAVGSGEDVQPTVDAGGDTTTVASGAAGIDFDSDVTTAANGLSAHDLSVATNAPGGYSIYIRHSQQLTNAFSDTIANHTGTNAAPTTFPAAGTEAWGYTTDDTDLSQFGAKEYAGFTTTNEQVVTNSSFTTGTEITRVGHQVGISGVTPSGSYQTVIIYTLVATF